MQDAYGRFAAADHDGTDGWHQRPRLGQDRGDQVDDEGRPEVGPRAEEAEAFDDGADSGPARTP